MWNLQTWSTCCHFRFFKICLRLVSSVLWFEYRSTYRFMCWKVGLLLVVLLWEVVGTLEVEGLAGGRSSRGACLWRVSCPWALPLLHSASWPAWPGKCLPHSCCHEGLSCCLRPKAMELADLGKQWPPVNCYIFKLAGRTLVYLPCTKPGFVGLVPGTEKSEDKSTEAI